MSILNKRTALLAATALALASSGSSAYASNDRGVVTGKRENMFFERFQANGKWTNLVNYYNGVKWKTESAKAYGAGFIVKHGAVTIKLTGDEELLNAYAFYGSPKATANGLDSMWQYSVAEHYGTFWGSDNLWHSVPLSSVTASVYNPELPKAPPLSK